MAYAYYLPPLQPWPVRENRQGGETMTVIGEGSVQVQPDRAVVQLAVVTQDLSLETAQQENASTMERVIQGLLSQNIPRENIRTSTYTVTPRYDYMNGQQVFRGYEVTNEISVEIPSIAQVGSVIDAAVKNGINRVSNIRFLVSDSESAYQRALSMAIENAWGKAGTMAETLRLTLHQMPISVIEISAEEPIAFKTYTLAVEGSATPIEPGQTTIRARVEMKLGY